MKKNVNCSPINSSIAFLCKSAKQKQKPRIKPIFSKKTSSSKDFQSVWWIALLSHIWCMGEKYVAVDVYTRGLQEIHGQRIYIQKYMNFFAPKYSYFQIVFLHELFEVPSHVLPWLEQTCVPSFLAFYLESASHSNVLQIQTFLSCDVWTVGFLWWLIFPFPSPSPGSWRVTLSFPLFCFPSTWSLRKYLVVSSFDSSVNWLKSTVPNCGSECTESKYPLGASVFSSADWGANAYADHLSGDR